MLRGIPFGPIFHPGTAPPAPSARPLGPAAFWPIVARPGITLRPGTRPPDISCPRHTCPTFPARVTPAARWPAPKGVGILPPDAAYVTFHPPVPHRRRGRFPAPRLPQCVPHRRPQCAPFAPHCVPCLDTCTHIVLIVRIERCALNDIRVSWMDVLNLVAILAGLGTPKRFFCRNIVI